MANEVQHGGVVLQGYALPVVANMAEQTMFDWIPFGRARRIVGHGDGHAPAISQLLQLPFPSPDARVIAATAVRFNKPMLRARVTAAPFLRPPGAQGIGHEGSSLARDSHHDKAPLPLRLVDPERNPSTAGPAGEIMVPNIDRLTPPASSGVLEQPHQFLLLGIDADCRISLLLKASALPGNVTKLPVPFRVAR